ncbi:MAG: type II secretion system protein GspL [Pseudomonadota bacterium]
MTETVIVRLGPTQHAPVAWIALDDGDIRHVEPYAEFESFASIAQQMNGPRIVAILPGADVAMRRLQSPPRAQNKFRSAALLLLEDELAQPIDELHVAVHRDDKGGRAFAVDRSIVAKWVDAFAEAELDLTMMIPDFECLGGTTALAVIFCEEKNVIADLGDFAFAAEEDVARPLLDAAVSSRPEAAFAYFGDGETVGGLAIASSEHLGAASAETFLSVAAARLKEGDAANLLQGEFRPKRRRVIDRARWLRPAALAASVAALALIFEAASGFRDGAIAERYQVEATRIHQEVFPNARNVSPRNHARTVLSQRGAASFSDISAAISQAVAENDDVTIDRIRFDAARGQFVFSIRSQTDAQIDAFRQTLSQFGVVATETGGFRRSSGYWVGELQASLG